MHMFSYTEICFIGISMEDVHFSECGIFRWDGLGHIPMMPAGSSGRCNTL